MNDLLNEAARGLREQSMRAPDPSRVEQTRHRIHTNLSRRTEPWWALRLLFSNRKPARGSLVVVPVLAFIAVSTAWASGILPRAMKSPSPEVASAELAEAVLVAIPQVRAVVDAHPSSTTPAPQSPKPSTSGQATVARPEARHPRRSSSMPRFDPRTTVSKPQPPTAAPVTSVQEPRVARIDALYRKAHRAHFGGGDPGEALARWEEYLARAKGDRFGPEAAFNRAICLVRLGRTAAARDALTPFAAGHYGSYRRHEAQRLLAALSGTP